MFVLTRLDILVLLGSLVLVVYLSNRRRRSAHPYPPGPKGLPLLGNLHQIPSNDEWVTYDRWCKELGSDIIYFGGAGMEFVVLNSIEAIRDLLDKRSAIYSDRPQFPMACELMGWGWFLPSLTYGEKWKKLRRVFTRYFHPNDRSVFESKHVKFIRGMLPKLLDSPENFFDITRHAVGGSAISMAYGLPIKARNDPYIELAENAIEYLNAGVLPGKFLVNILPVLKYLPDFFPGAGFKRFAKVGRKFQMNLRTKPFDKVIQEMREGTARLSLTVTSLQEIDQSIKGSQLDDEIQVVKDAAGSVFAAAADTTLSAVRSFFVAMLYRPDIQKKAQQELDRVLCGRFPELSDEPDLPYITAIVKEVLRWKPLAPLAVPHMSTQDDVYRGYYIPKDTIIIANSWSLLRDPEHYPEPDVYNPDRFMRDGKLNPDVRDPNMIIFGFGRRICPGSHVALSFLWLTAATILSTFDISSGVDENGEPIKPHVDYHTSIVSEPLPFKCSIKPRSKETAELIKGLESVWDG